MNELILAFSIAAAWAGIFWAVNNWSAIVLGVKEAVGALMGLQVAYKVTTAVAIVEARKQAVATLSVAGAWLAAHATVLLIATGILMLILLVQDFYIWMKGGKSVFGEWLGPWNEKLNEWKKMWEDVTKAIKSFIEGNVIEMIGKAWDALKGKRQEITKKDVRGQVNDAVEENVSNPANDFFSGFLENITNAHNQRVQLNPAAALAYQEKYGVDVSTLNKTNNNNITNNFFYPNNIEPTEISKAIWNSAPVDDANMEMMD